MQFTWAGHRIKFTDSIYEDHLLVDRDGTVWFGNGGLMWNVYSYLLRGNELNIEESFLHLISESQRKRRSIRWTSCIRS